MRIELSLCRMTLHLHDLATEVLAYAKHLGCTAAEVAASTETGFSLTVRMGSVETLEYNNDQGFAVTVYRGQHVGSASSTSLSTSAVKMAVEKASAIAQLAHEDPYAGLADPQLMASRYPDLDLYHPWLLSPEQGIELARACEAYALAYDPLISNSEGASLGTHQYDHVYANSHGFVGAYPTTSHSLSCSVVAKQGDDMQRDSDYTMARDPADMLSSQWVAESAAKRSLQRLGARRLSTRNCPMIFAAEIARGLLGHFIAAISGGNLYRQSSFLLDHLGKPVFGKHIHIEERPHLLKGAGSAPFDSEGVATQARDIVTEGVLQGYVLDSYAARKLAMQTTGNAGGVHNLYIHNHGHDLSALLKQMDTGLLITELMGQGVNIVTGDYSRGAFGYWVENGEIQYPVHEVTIAGNLKQMLGNLQQVGNDYDLRGNIRTGSLLIDGMTLAGL